MRTYSAHLAIAATYLLSTSTPAAAESYLGIGPYYTANDVRAMFPHATIEDQRAGWQAKHQKLFRITGGGLNGTVIVFMKDITVTGDSNPVEKKISEVMDFGDFSESRTFVVDYVRWIPDGGRRLSSLVGVYGSKFSKTVDKINLHTYYIWKNGEVSALIDGQSVIQVDYSHNLDEKMARFIKLMRAKLERNTNPTPEPTPKDQYDEDGLKLSPEGAKYGEVSEVEMYDRRTQTYRKVRSIWNGEMWVPVE